MSALVECLNPLPQPDSKVCRDKRKSQMQWEIATRRMTESIGYLVVPEDVSKQNFVKKTIRGTVEFHMNQSIPLCGGINQHQEGQYGFSDARPKTTE